MSGRRRWIAGAAAVAVLAAVALALWWSGRSGEPAAGGGGTATTRDGDELALSVDLYFPGDGLLLRREHRELAPAADPREQLLALARAVLAGPSTPSLHAPLPDGVDVRSLYLSPQGVVYLDLGGEEGAPPPRGGTTAERLRVYSLVNSLLLNVGEARSAVLLWNGEQPQTLSGHLDLTRPLLPDPSLVARDGNAP